MDKGQRNAELGMQTKKEDANAVNTVFGISQNLS